MVVLGSEGSIDGINRGARALLLSEFQTKGNDLNLNDSALPAGKQFSEFFRMKDREKVAFWQKSQVNEPQSGGEYPEVELNCGARVRLRSQTAGGASRAIALLPTGAGASAEESRAQAELLSLSEWLEQGVILFDAEENVRLLNLRFAQLAGLAPGEAEKYKTLDSLVERLRGQSAEPESFAQRWLELARRTEGGEREEVHLLRPAARVLERASRPVFDAAGNKLGRIELYRDLTAQRMFQAKLLQTERLAALGQMVSGVAHELSNPLTSILGYAQRLLLRDDAGTHFEEIRRIFTEAERAGAILRRMLLAARESAPERRAVPLNAIVQRTIELQRFSLAAERIRVDVQLEADLPQVIGDAGQLQQVLMNLLGNARQAIEGQGHGGTIRVRTRRTEDNRVRLEVSDSGPGIPESILSRIFDPFFTTKPAGVGTGLGLSIALSLVREHGGQVHVLSPRGSGAEFIVELPAAGQKDLEERAGQKPLQVTGRTSAARTYPLRGKGEAAPRVLVVEDEPTVANLIADVLRDEGFEIEIHLDGREAAERAASEKFDLIVCDMKMPNLDGQSLYESLSRAKKTVQQRFLFVTGDVLGAKTHEFLSRNQLPHVAKPFRVEELLEKVHQVLQPAGTASSPRVTPLRKNTATTG
jgi:two-component system NtrC family sensor kinase